MRIKTDENLSKYTHAAPKSYAEVLLEAVDKCKKAGLKVLGGYSSSNRVPNSYRYTSRMHAPYYVYDSNTNQAVMVDGKLQTASGGSRSRCVVHVEGAVVEYPEGLRCQKRTPEKTELYVA